MSDDQDGCDCEWVNVLSGIGPTGWSHTKDHYTVVCVCVFQNSFDWIAFPIPPVTPRSNGAVQILDACFCLITVALWVAVSSDIRVVSVAVVCL